MGVPYDVHDVACRWQAAWDASRLYEPDVSQPVFYNLVEFPYPSAEGLHAGHAMTYCGADAHGRYRRMQGQEVFQPIGFDAFGINAENYARKIGEHPRVVIARTTKRYRDQLTALGCGWDWSHSVTTSEPAYYRWTQWLFVQLFRAGLAYRAEGPVIWCPSCETVLAREQVDDDGASCERCRARVTERVMTQWWLRTTRYRDRLRSGLEGLDWSEPAKNRQRRWIGGVGDAPGHGLHDWLISRQRYWGPPIPIVHCSSCGGVPVPEDELPVLLPEIDDWQGISPLARLDDWARTSCPRCGGPARRETDVSDTFFDSCWYFLRYPSTEFDDRPWHADRVRQVDLYAGGREHLARHHLYARFATMALHDLGLVPFDEPFPVLRLHGDLLHEGRRMSKTRGNVVNPDDYVDRHGADVFRAYLLFCSRWDEGGDFRDDGIVGIERFVGRLWRRAEHDPQGQAGDRVIDAVTRAYETMRFNLVVARLMEAVRTVDARTLTLLLAPITPYLAEELWCRLGGRGSVHVQPWPVTRQ